MNNNKEMLGQAPVGRLLFKLALPTVVAQLINMLYNIVDRIFIGHIPDIGDLALTGVGVCMPLIMIVSAFAALVSSGGAPRASIFMGKNCPEALGDYMAGPNHTVPTGGTAKFSSPLSVDDFVKKTQYTYFTRDALARIADDVSYFATKEGLTAHAKSATVRFEEEK